MKKLIIGLMFTLIAGFSFAQTTVVTVVTSEAELTEMNQMITAAAIAAELEGEGPYTVFAPNNEAWKTLNNNQVTHLLNNLGDLRNVLNIHFVSGKITPDGLSSVETLKSFEGQNIHVKHNNGVTKLDDGNLDTLDATILNSFETDNGIVYIIDHVMKPGVF